MKSHSLVPSFFLRPQGLSADLEPMSHRRHVAGARPINHTPDVTAKTGRLVADRAGGRSRIWVATSPGLIRLDAVTFAVERCYGAAELGSTALGLPVVDPATGAVFVAVHTAGGSSVARVDGDTVAVLSLGGSAGDVVWSPASNAVFIAVASADPAAPGVVRWDGTHAMTVATEGQLASVARSNGAPFGASTLVLDESGGVLVVGGRVHEVSVRGELSDGGLAWIDLTNGRIDGVSTRSEDLLGEDEPVVASRPFAAPAGSPIAIAVAAPVSTRKNGIDSKRAARWVGIAVLLLSALAATGCVARVSPAHVVVVDDGDHHHHHPLPRPRQHHPHHGHGR